MNIDFAEIEISSGTGTQSFTGLGIDMSEAGVEPFVKFILSDVSPTTNTNRINWNIHEAYATGLAGSETWSVHRNNPNGAAGFISFQYATEDEIGVRDRATNMPTTEDLTFTIDSWDADGFTINKTVSAQATKCIIMYGTAKYAQVIVNESNTATGTQNVTGLSWNPSDNAIVFSSGGVVVYASLPNERLNSSAAYYYNGCASSNAQFCHSGRILGGSVTSLAGCSNTDSSFIKELDNAGNIFYEAQFTGWITNGFSMTLSTAPGSGRATGFLVIDDGADGDKCEAALWNTQAGTGAESFDSGSATGYSPQLVYLQTDGNAVDTLGNNNDSNLSKGFYNGTSQECYSTFSDYKPDPSYCYHRFDNTATAYLMDPNNGSVTDDIRLTAINADGFDANHDANAGAKFVGVALMGMGAECIYYRTVGTPPQTIKVNGICYTFSGAVEDTGKTSVNPSGSYDNCGTCQGSPAPYAESSPAP